MTRSWVLEGMYLYYSIPKKKKKIELLTDSAVTTAVLTYALATFDITSYSHHILFP